MFLFVIIFGTEDWTQQLCYHIMNSLKCTINDETKGDEQTNGAGMTEKENYLPCSKSGFGVQNWEKKKGGACALVWDYIESFYNAAHTPVEVVIK